MQLILALASLALTLAPTPNQEDGSRVKVPAWWDSFPEASADLTLDVGDDGSYPNMMALANDYAQLTGQHLLIGTETRAILESSPTGIQARIVVPKVHVQAFFETLLIENQFMLQLLRESSPRLLTIQSLRTQERNTARARARLVPREHLELMRDHPAMLVTTTLALPYTDVRQLSNSMRTIITDANTQQMLPAGNSSSLVLTGFGTATADLVLMLERIDAESKVGWERDEARRRLEEAAQKTDTEEPSDE
ncbi:MAG: hypothetical protein ACI8Y8_001135 [Planctomycetota bacterium]|jgi:hypothetical protein